MAADRKQLAGYIIAFNLKLLKLDSRYGVQWYLCDVSSYSTIRPVEGRIHQAEGINSYNLCLITSLQNIYSG
jgi:hypothetical protein